MRQITFIAKCFLWLAALLAPAQAIFAMRCQCDHCAQEHVEHRHDHQHGANCSHLCQHDRCTGVCCQFDSVSTGHSQCQCDHHTQPQQPGTSAFQVRGQVANYWGWAHFSAIPHRTSSQRGALAHVRQTASAMETCAVLCRFLT
ncbi:hypothetical protein M4951_16175 [Blastopirellula sp. J2-11]|uniref:hypothetical protein n=1 Tax=Blastopirellula sp. J2-11 TaxID=2943192 RepID=UPI0021C6DE9C|nr:hypothetical protein [Blastopirellula sp. J2-11]UUO04919.1 hypothetical protein M4951_16175 [Blastopirellula sp. J2-11]